MSLRAYEDFALEPLKFTIRGKTYTVQPPSIDVGLQLVGVFAGTDQTLAGKPMDELFALVMGDTWQQMRDDRVPFEAAFRAGMASVADAQEGRQTAVAVWESGIDPEALAAYLAANQQPNSKDSQQSPSTASGNQARTASTTSTNSRRATPPRKKPTKAAPARSRGSKSSAPGTS